MKNMIKTLKNRQKEISTFQNLLQSSEILI